MLPSCTICKKRKKKCDFNLPSCKHCESMGTHCEYFDEGLGNNVPREYLKNLNDNIILLKSEIEKFKKKIEKRTSNKNFSTFTKDKLYETVKNGTFIEGKNSALQYYGPCSLISMVYMSSMMLGLKESSFEQISVLEYKSIPSVKISFDYSIITTDHSKILITNYLNNIYPHFSLLPETFFHFDLMVKNYPEEKQLYIFLIMLVSSAHLMRKRSDFIAIKIMLQQKIMEKMKTKLNNEDGDSLLILLFYTLYELLDPEIGTSVWRTLTLACDVAERLQLKNLDDNKPLPGVMARHIPKCNFLKVLTYLDTEVMISIGKLPLIDLSTTQLTFVDNNLVNHPEFFKILYEDTSCCDILKLLQYPKFFNITDSELWLIASPLLCHKCKDCQINYDVIVLEILNSSFNTISNCSNSNRKGILLYWTALSKISVALINLVIIKRFYSSSYIGIIEEKAILNKIYLGKELISEISSQWYYANTVKYFIESITDILFT